MGRFLIDNATATQGGYAGVVASLQPNSAKKVTADGDGEKSNLKVQGSGSGEKTTFLSEEDKKANKTNNTESLMDEEDIEAITEKLNDFVSQLNVNLRFTLHKDTSMLRVTFVDVKNNKVLKEFPPEEYLDMIAKIRDFIGSIIDEKV